MFEKEIRDQEKILTQLKRLKLNLEIEELNFKIIYDSASGEERRLINSFLKSPEFKLLSIFEIAET